MNQDETVDSDRQNQPRRATRASSTDANYLTFEPLYMERVWGGRKLAALFGRPLPVTNPIGESWELVDRADAQSVVCEGRLKGAALHQLWLNHRRQIFGEGYDYERFPLLVKILDASDVLSVQVHPPAHRKIECLEEPKTELWYFVDTDEGASIYVGLKRGTMRENFQSALADGTVERLMHRLPTQPGSFMFLPSGRLHAIGAGNVLFEVQQNSDTTYRVFDWNRLGLDGKPRPLQVEQSLQCIDFNDFEPALGEGHNERLVSHDCLTVDRWVLDQPRPANPLPKFSIFQVIQGRVSLGHRREFGFGDLFVVPAHSHQSLIASKNDLAIVLRTTL
jgi:mannose-6-phosphate isomerase